jgi:hypothetical protein
MNVRDQAAEQSNQFLWCEGVAISSLHAPHRLLSTSIACRGCNYWQPSIFDAAQSPTHKVTRDKSWDLTRDLMWIREFWF